MSPAEDKSGRDEQAAIDQRNKSFWDELCGTQFARQIGVSDSSPASLKKFDDLYMSFYPYLARHVPLSELKGRKVMEVGLGYGTLSQKIAEAGADYSGLDIAAGPVHMVNHRLKQIGLAGKAVQGSVLECPFADGEFDWVVAIGCLHHTGNLQKALDEVWRVLKPNGRAMVMVYYAYSYRRWAYHPSMTLKYFLHDKFGVGNRDGVATEAERAHYDASTKDGAGAPETSFTSASEMRRMTRRWSRCDVHRENIGQEWLFRSTPRDVAIRRWGPLVGLDIYCDLTK
ncbi:MAG: class I SAM-dependent methyltransferase [Gammaproteobacteria bacterium]